MWVGASSKAISNVFSSRENRETFAYHRSQKLSRHPRATSKTFDRRIIEICAHVDSSRRQCHHRKFSWQKNKRNRKENVIWIELRAQQRTIVDMGKETREIFTRRCCTSSLWLSMYLAVFEASTILLHRFRFFLLFYSTRCILHLLGQECWQ